MWTKVGTREIRLCISRSRGSGALNPLPLGDVRVSETLGPRAAITCQLLSGCLSYLDASLYSHLRNIFL